MVDTKPRMEYLSDKELKALFCDTVQFGWHKISNGKFRLSDKWQVAKNVDENGWEKYIFARPVSQWSRKHGHLEISIDAKYLKDGKLIEEAQKELVNYMHMMDVVVHRGKNGADPKSFLHKQNQATRFLGNQFDKNKQSMEAIKAQLGGNDNKYNSEYIDFIENSKKACDNHVQVKNDLSVSCVWNRESVAYGNNNASVVQRHVTINGLQVFEEDRIRYKSLVIKKIIWEIFGAIANAFSGVIEPSKKVLATLCKNPNTTSVAIALVSLLWNAPYAIVRLIGYAIDSIKNKILEIDTSQPPKDSFRSKIGYHIAKFFQEHKHAVEAITSAIRIGLQSVVAFIVLAVNPVYVVQMLIDLTADVVRNMIPAVGDWVDKHPIITQIVVTTITMAAQLTVGLLTGSLPLALFTMALTLGTQIIVSSYGQSVVGWCVAKILNSKTEENNVVLTVEEQGRIDKVRECIEIAKEPIGRVGNAVSNLIVGAYGAVNQLYSKMVSCVIEVAFGCHLKNPEKTICDSKSQDITNTQLQIQSAKQLNDIHKTEKITEHKDESVDNVTDSYLEQMLKWLEEKLQYFADKYRQWAYIEETSEQRFIPTSSGIVEKEETTSSTEQTMDQNSQKFGGFGAMVDDIRQKLDNFEEKLKNFENKHNPSLPNVGHTDEAISQFVKDIVPVVASVIDDVKN